MPRGAAPGERRGGRKKGVPNKATVERSADLDQALAAAFEALGPEFIDSLTPAQYQDRVWREAAKATHHRAAFAMAGQAAPYFDAKPAPKSSEPAESDKDTRIIGGLPD